MKRVLILEENESLQGVSTEYAESDVVLRKYFVAVDGATVYEIEKNRHGPREKLFVYPESSL